MAARNPRIWPNPASFKLGPQLGAGTVGVVHQATSPDLSHRVALKLLRPGVADDDLVVKRFEREIAITERLDHPHIVRYYGGGKLDGQLFYAMQLLEHGSLKQRLHNQGSLDWSAAAAYAAQIASALEHIHAHGIIHRDVKPSNLFFDDQGNLVLGDFGIARDTHAEDITAQGITVGTYSYMSPEQIAAERSIDGRSDLYSLGCVLLEMLTGQPPFAGTNFTQVWEQHLHKRPPSVRGLGVDCPEWLDELIHKLLAKEAEDRPASARAVEQLLRKRLHPEQDEAGAPQFDTRNKPPARPAARPDKEAALAAAPERWREHPRLAIGLVTLAALAVVVAVSVWTLR